MKKIVFVFLLIGIVINAGYAQTSSKTTETKKSHKDLQKEVRVNKKIIKLQRQPVVCVYLDGFTTVGDVKTVSVGKDSQIGIVVVKKDIDGDIFSAMVIPYRKISVGTKVKLIDIQYSQIQGPGDYFMLVEE